MRKKLHLSWPIGLSFLVVVGVAALLPLVLSIVEDTHTALDGGGLAKLVEAEDVDLFLSSASPSLISSVLSFLGSDRELPLLSDGGRYELVVSRTASGAVWVVAATDTRGHVESLFTNLGVTMSLPEPIMPLSSDPLFRQSRKERGTEFLWMQPGVLDGSSILSALLAPAEWVLLTWDDEGQSGQLTLFGLQEMITPRTELGPVPKDQGTLLSLSLRPSTWMKNAWISLREGDPELAQGIEGIALSLLYRSTGSDDLLELFSSLDRPTYIGVTKRNGSLFPYIVGSADEEVIDTWMKRIRTEHAVGEVRTIDVGEYVYTDVALTEDEEPADSTRWTVLPISSDGSMMIATRGTAFLIGSPTDIDHALQSGVTHPSTDGRVSIGWAAELLELPSSFVEGILGDTNTHISWSQRQSALRRSFEWQFTE